jgi:hypothetical protein
MRSPIAKIFLLGTSIVFSQELAQQIINELQKHPYAEVAPLIAKMQDEAMHQPGATTPPPPVGTTTPTENPK